jgi:hypothetical protein
MNCEDIAKLGPLYLSGELDSSRTREFTEHLEACRTCAGELQWQTQLDAFVRSSVLSEEINSAPIEQRIRELTAAKRPWFSARRLLVAAGVTAILLAGTLGYRAAFMPQPPRLCVDAAQDHRNEVTHQQHRRWLSDPTAIADLAESNGFRVSLTALAPAGYHLERAKLCRLDGYVFLHVVYAQGTLEFSAYLRSLDSQPVHGPMRETVGGMHPQETDAGHEHVAYFRTSQLVAIFVTDQSSKAALSLARFAVGVL